LNFAALRALYCFQVTQNSPRESSCSQGVAVTVRMFQSLLGSEACDVYKGTRVLRVRLSSDSSAKFACWRQILFYYYYYYYIDKLTV